MKRFLALLLCLLLVTPALAAGDEQDPVITESYLVKVWQPQFLSKFTFDTQDAYRKGFRALAERRALRQQTAEAKTAGRQQGRLLLKKGDILRPQTGCKVLLRDGGLSAEASLIDVSHGAPAGASLVKNTLYLQSSTPTKGLTVTTDTAELWLCGAYEKLTAQGTDIASLGAALEKMGLFHGMNGSFALEQNATRAQGLVMFLRLLGKEREALACTDAVPFTDLAGHWAKPYVAYAYREGLTAGTSATAFSPESPVTAQHYLTFLLRALHYKENTDFTYKTVLSDAQKPELFTKEELAALSARRFCRGGMVYLSYYALTCADGESGKLLLDTLTDGGSVTVANAAAGLALARGGRLTQ